MRKRVCAGILVLVLFCLSGCTQQTTTETPTLRIGVALYQQDDTFIGSLAENLERLAQEDETLENMKITLSFADADGNQSTQNDQIDRYLSFSYDVICVNIVDRTAAAVIIDKAKAANVPVIFFNREPVEEDLDRWEEAYYVGSVASVAGQLQGKMVTDIWYAQDSTLDFNGDGILQYVMLEGEPGHQDALLRTEYSVRAIEQAGITTQRLDTDTANWARSEAYSVADGWITEFGTRIELVLANNDDMALGAIDAFLDYGYAVANLPCIMGVDGSTAALEALEAGSLAGTVMNDAEGQARAILDLAYARFRDIDPNEVVTLDKGQYVWLTYTAVLAEETK